MKRGDSHTRRLNMHHFEMFSCLYFFFVWKGVFSPIFYIIFQWCTRQWAFCNEWNYAFETMFDVFSSSEHFGKFCHVWFLFTICSFNNIVARVMENIEQQVSRETNLNSTTVLDWRRLKHYFKILDDMNTIVMESGKQGRCWQQMWIQTDVLIVLFTN